VNEIPRERKTDRQKEKKKMKILEKCEKAGELWPEDVRLDMYRNGVDLSGEARQCEKVENMKNMKNKKNKKNKKNRTSPVDGVCQHMRRELS
jgi:hypothetical protein